MLDAVLLEEVGSTLHHEWGEGSHGRLSGVEMLLVDDEQGGSDAGDEAMAAEPSSVALPSPLC